MNNTIVNFDTPSIYSRPQPLQYSDRGLSLTSIINAATTSNNGTHNSIALSSYLLDPAYSNIHPEDENHNHDNANNPHNLNPSIAHNYNGALSYPAMLRDLSLTSINMDFQNAPVSPPTLPFRGMSGTFFPDGDGDITLLPNLRGLSDFQMAHLQKDDENNNHQIQQNHSNNNSHNIASDTENSYSKSEISSSNSSSPLSTGNHSVVSSPIDSVASVYPSIVMPTTQSLSNMQLKSAPMAATTVPTSSINRSQYSYSFPNLNEDLLPSQTASLPNVPSNDNIDVHYRKRHRLDDLTSVQTGATSVSLPSHSPQLQDARGGRTQSQYPPSSSSATSPVEHTVARLSSPIPSRNTLPQGAPVSKRSHSNDDQLSGQSEGDKELQKKMKHQLTDRQRRAKIKESMDQLKGLLPFEKEKTDQATVISESVKYVRTLKDEVNELRKKIAEMELSHSDPKGKGDSGLYRTIVGSPLENVQHALNGAGVSVWRIGLDCRLLEVNMVFEMLTGYSSSELIGTIPCRAPLYASTNFLPKAFMRHFANSGVTAASFTTRIDKSELNNKSDLDHNHEKDAVVEVVSTNSDFRSKQLVSTAPLFPNSTIANYPIIPQSELTSFFPPHSKVFQNDQHNMVSANYLLNHLINLPPTHVLKLLTRLNTTYGDTLELIQTISLVRTPDGMPDYILSFTTPDSRRLVKPSALLNPSPLVK